MDARVGDRVVTPGMGKAIEVNALWYNALRAMAVFAARRDRLSAVYAALADRVAARFQRFWYAPGGYCHDVIDTLTGDDPTLRPNQIFAVSLPESPLSPERRRAVVDACAARLLTSVGVRSLAPDHRRCGRGSSGPSRSPTSERTVTRPPPARSCCRWPITSPTTAWARSRRSSRAIRLHAWHELERAR
jgi:predicted glycogen debranching enzyme